MDKTRDKLIREIYVQILEYRHAFPLIICIIFGRQGSVGLGFVPRDIHCNIEPGTLSTVIMKICPVTNVMLLGI